MKPVATSIPTNIEEFQLALEAAFAGGKAIGSALASAETPPRKPWAGLTEQERNDLEDYCEMIIGRAAFDAIEAKLKEKNV